MSGGKKETLQIATKELHSCYLKDGIVAGSHHFTDYWARDGYFAALGSLEIGDTEIVRKMTELFFSYQRQDGLIPYRVMRGPMVSLKKYFLGKPPLYTNPKPTYKLRNVGQEIFDGTTLTLLFSALLGLRGWNQAKDYKPKIEKALKLLESKERQGLLNDGVMAEWNDTALKTGNLLYSNILYWYMYDRLTSWAKRFDSTWSQKLKTKTEKISESLYKRLWNGKFFADWHDYKRQDFFYPFGNCLAVTWGLTSKKESESILLECKKIKVSFTLESNSPRYPWWRISLLQYFVGMGDYQNKSLLWWQPGIAYLTALKKMKKKKDAEKFEWEIVKKVTSDRSIHECYERNGSPLKRFIYKSENPFAWSSGMLLWALKYK